MTEGLRAARQLAGLVRFSGDTLRAKSSGCRIRAESIKSHYYQSALQISAQVTPELSDQLGKACARLKLLPGNVAAFVYASPEIQADCYAGSNAECLARFSSSLIDLLDEQEFGFVAGHELGHFLLDHGITRMEARQNSVEFLIEQRSQEISVDRIGLLACGSLDVAIRALMKTVSGLPSRHLRFDVGSFISQLQRSSTSFSQADFGGTHPSIIVRCRALLWFSLSDVFTRGAEAYSSEQMAGLDERIQSDLGKYVDGPARDRIAFAKTDLAFWMSAYEVIQDGTFERREQAKIAEMFGRDVLEKLKSFLGSLSASEIKATVDERVTTAREELEGFIPENFESEVRKIKESVSTALAHL